MSSHESIDRPEAAAASDAASAAASDVASDEQYRLTHASQIGTVLRDLAWQKCTLNVRSGRGRETVSSVLHVDPASRTFIFDWCRTDEEARAVLEAEENAISASLRGVPVNFAIGRPEPVQYQGGPAFRAPFPDKLYHFQRRRHFRARTLVTRGYGCEGRLDDGTVVKLDISDLSLSGVGLRSRTVGDTQLPVGTRIARARLDFRELGKLDLDLQVVGHWLVGRDDSAIHHFGCAFVNPDGRLENTLQRLVFALELAHRG
ncbi:flagellar brake protein [Cupriavidus gilardii]|uniref:Flagellar brake protein YcgR n=1 Tax=Cupriavidus gilardii TaxID=82541 RepID=A0A6N1BEB1_9BURK|nr:flagellar brake protein [Cupriavidus gilardii]ALD92282.1 putative glycosyltransferase [Cupriavidus gilardii CR3]QQE09166.1 flagellar brake protein [Cupriavidus sp. ISTL7]KAB0595740.1 flagellar brake protein [Cupriavidus gilardii]MCT9014779.1 flagellar brake protein [Cupriavidus gilardii]MCT9053191.1 flagellar brake protein [Cupriavidus gilardii]